MKQNAQPQFPDERGLLWSYQLDGAGGGFQQSRLGDLESNPSGFDWFHLRSDETDSILWMQEKGLDPHVIDALSALETRPRMAELAGGILINLRGVNTNPGSDPEDMIAIRIWFNKDMIITARRSERRLLSIEDIRQRIENSHGPKSVGEFVLMLVELLANRICDVVDSIDDDLSRVETDLSENNIAMVQQHLSTARRQTAAVRRYLAPQREALSDLYRNRKILTDDECYQLHYQTDRIIHYVEDLDLARERALVLQGELQNRLAERQNERMYLLSIVAAIFLPLSFLTGVFGMNVAGLPGIENPYAFGILSIGMIIIAIGLIGYMRWRKWL